MIVAAVEDLIFASKIGQTAKNLGLPIVFARSREETIQRVRENETQMVLVDLNSRRCEPIELIREMKEDEALRAIRIVGYVSHVQGDIIVAARKAGCDRVMARSIFSSRLPDILKMTDNEQDDWAAELADSGPRV